nr:CoA transferase [Nesterenkonia muleiensis]
MSHQHPLAEVLKGISVAHLGGNLSEFTVRILGDLGARIVTVQPEKPSTDSRTEEAHSAIRQAHYTAGAETRTTVEESTALIELLSQHEVVINACEGGSSVPVLSAQQATALREKNPEVLICHITPYGLNGPWAGRPASDLTLLAAGGFMGSCGYDDGVEAGLPVAATGGQVNHVTGMIAAIAILGALLQQGQQPRASGRVLDISAQHALAVSTEMAIPYWDYTGQEVIRHTGRHAMPRQTPRWQHPCGDGKHLLALPLYIDDRRFAALKEWMESEGFDHGLDDEKYQRSQTRELHMFDVVDAIRRFASLNDSGWMFIEAQKRKLPWAPVNTPFECVEDSHFTRHRTTIEEISEGERTIRRVRLPFLISGATAEKGHEE